MASSCIVAADIGFFFACTLLLQPHMQLVWISLNEPGERFLDFRAADNPHSDILDIRVQQSQIYCQFPVPDRITNSFARSQPRHLRPILSVNTFPSFPCYSQELQTLMPWSCFDDPDACSCNRLFINKCQSWIICVIQKNTHHQKRGDKRVKKIRVYSGHWFEPF